MPRQGPLVIAQGFFDPNARILFTQNRLGHWHQDDTWIFVTFRVADSLPRALWEQWRREIRSIPHQPTLGTNEYPPAIFAQEGLNRLEGHLDRGYGSCPLRDPKARKALVGVLRLGHGIRYRLGEFVLMPNHVHVLFQPSKEHGLAKTMLDWKGWGTKRINGVLNRQGRLWQKDYWDRVVRGLDHLERIRNYIGENPAKAGLSEGEFTLGCGDDGSLSSSK